VFAVDSGPHPFLAVEVATDARLFDRLNHANERRRDNWFASWERGPLSSGRTYRLPTEVWVHLKGADQLYFRIWASAQPDQWVSPLTSTLDSEYYTAPLMEIVDTAANKAGGATLSLVKVVHEPTAPAEDEVTEVQVHYREQTSSRFETVKIRPGLTVLPVEQVY